MPSPSSPTAQPRSPARLRRSDFWSTWQMASLSISCINKKNAKDGSPCRPFLFKNMLALPFPEGFFLQIMNQVLSKMPRHLNFIDHIQRFESFDEDSKSRIMISDQGLNMSEGGVTTLPDRWEVPTDFNIYIGSDMMALSHSFVEYCIWAWDNFPRTLLMYHANSVSPAQSYFQTLICNSLEFSETTVNTDLHFAAQDHLYRPRYINDYDWRSVLGKQCSICKEVQ